MSYLAVIDVVSSSQGTEPSPVDTDSVLLKRKITYAFTDLIQPLDILSVFHKYNLHILTEREIVEYKYTVWSSLIKHRKFQGYILIYILPNVSYCQNPFYILKKKNSQKLVCYVIHLINLK